MSKSFVLDSSTMRFGLDLVDYKGVFLKAGDDYLFLLFLFPT